MKRLAIVALMATAFVAVSAGEASAQSPFGFGFQPFGFYQPYGVRYRSRTPTPPYFALNPPVYYGARHARPYGISPFASYPVVSAPENYKGRLRSDFYEGPIREGHPRQSSGTCSTCNPHLHTSTALPKGVKQAQVGKIRRNPFVETADQLVVN